jgi:hypothetical protein
MPVEFEGPYRGTAAPAPACVGSCRARVAEGGVRVNAE